MTPLENIEAWRARVMQAAIGMEARWTERRLVEVDLDLARRLVEQRNLFRVACDGGMPGEVAKHGAAMCRGYAEAVKVLEDTPLPIEDAYTFGYDPQTDTRVAIGGGKAPALRVAEINPHTVYLTYDEVAALLGRVAALKPIVAVKRQWPGCEILGDTPINQFDQPIPADDEAEQDV